ncbi:MAG: peptidylprolyl isomerase [Desulfobulbaceae bacterium]|nr:MAG: peptidylprolyl isomerase [Desulfobulbaceae bacterium]
MPYLLRTLLFLILLPGLAQAEVIDRVVAVVNDGLITLSELNSEGALHFDRIRQQVPPEQRAETLAAARQEILQGLIERKLIEQRAAERGIEVSDEEVDLQYYRMMEQNNLSEEEFTAELAKAGLTPAGYKKNLHSQILRQRLLSIEIHSKVVVTDEEIEEYYHNEYGQTKDDGLHILQIGCQWGPGGKSASKEEARRRARQLRGMVQAGENFQEIAQSYSELPSAADGGDIGVFKRDELSPAMREGLADLRPGEISELIEHNDSFQFFKVLSAKSGNIITQAPLESVHEEIRDLILQRKLKEKFDKWLVLLRENSYIKEQL